MKFKKTFENVHFIPLILFEHYKWIFLSALVNCSGRKDAGTGTEFYPRGLRGEKVRGRWQDAENQVEEGASRLQEIP